MIVTAFQRIENSEFLTGIVRAGMPADCYGDLPLLVPVNFLWGGAFVHPDWPDRIDHDRIKWAIERLSPKWTGDLLLLNLEKLEEPDDPNANQLRGRTSHCLKQPKVWTEASLKAALTEAEVQVKRTADILNSVVETVRKVCDMKLAHWGSCPNADTRDAYYAMTNQVGKCLPHHAEPQQWAYQCYLWWVRHVQLQAELIAPTIDWYAPSLYLVGVHGYLANGPWGVPFLDDTTGETTPLHAATATEFDVWSYSTLVALRIAKGLMPAKPMIPFLSLQWWQQGDQNWSHGYGTELVGPKLALDMLDFVRPLCDSVVLWCQHKNYDQDSGKFYRSPTFSAARSWAARQACYQAMAAFLTKEIDE